MLVLSRKQGEQIIIGDGITITVVSIAPGKVRIGIVAPKDTPVHREEVYEAIHGMKPNLEISRPIHNDHSPA